jgi:hypothetical protein
MEQTMNKIISMNHSAFGDIEQTVELTTLERLSVRRKLAEVLQKQTGWNSTIEEGWLMEGDVFVALVDFANTDPAHVLNAQQEVDWHNRIIFDVPAMVENTVKQMQPLKERIDARMSEAAQRAKGAFHHK